MSLRVGYSDPLTMVDTVYVDGWWRGDWFWLVARGKNSSRWSRLGGIIGVVFGLETHWAPD
jgi:hypothetical protein